MQSKGDAHALQPVSQVQNQVIRAIATSTGTTTHTITRILRRRTFRLTAIGAAAEAALALPAAGLHTGIGAKVGAHATGDVNEGEVLTAKQPERLEESLAVLVALLEPPPASAVMQSDWELYTCAAEAAVRCERLSLMLNEDMSAREVPAGTG